MNDYLFIHLVAAYSTHEDISVFPPHVVVGGDVHRFCFKRAQHAALWRNKETHAFPMRQQVAHILCQDTQEQVSVSFPGTPSAYF